MFKFVLSTRFHFNYQLKHHGRSLEFRSILLESHKFGGKNVALSGALSCVSPTK